VCPTCRPPCANRPRKSCERENQWLDEAPYYIDTSLVPRGGARRRKSMEPKALANLNGMLVSTPAKPHAGGGLAAPSRESQTAPCTPANRRDSCLWMRTPEDDDGGIASYGDDDAGLEWGLLTPVPKTPAPETVARLAAGMPPATPSEFGDDDVAAAAAAADREALLMRTCPPARTGHAGGGYGALGEGVLAREKDQAVVQRLMAARRKSLQYAPKVGSPLARTWQ